MLVRAGIEALDDVPRHLCEREHLAALGFGEGISGLAGGEGGEVGFVHGAAGLGAEDEEGFFGVHPGFGAVVGDELANSSIDSGNEAWNQD